MLEYFKLAAQITIAISIYNVWFLRFNKSTIYRGKDAKNMKDEFISYGLKGPFVKNLLLNNSISLLFPHFLILFMDFFCFCILIANTKK